VIDFIREHHGTMITRYQYGKARSSAQNPDEVDPEMFRYPRPGPVLKTPEPMKRSLRPSTRLSTPAKMPVNLTIPT